MHRRVRRFGQPELTYRPILRILTCETPAETNKKKKMVAPEQMEHWPAFCDSEGRNSEFMSTSERSKGRVTYQKSANA